ncbi:hypothetical protein HUO09_17820 [Vibrio sp. Y2-5]|uniref:hypothetical protein n=1 Tax=Vibrio sp. Y2-5 TaxID=2743977 RepID=UPI0016617A1E|nr:hypothetical protein [Vibrio sp. Y2-5]MBD0788217.1 hypothetical protein [Vibrio sp. Y2-5]
MIITDSLQSAHATFSINPNDETFKNFIQVAYAELGESRVNDCMKFYEIFGNSNLTDFYTNKEVMDTVNLEPLMNERDLNSVAQEFSGCITLSEATTKAGDKVISAARRLAQFSTSSFCIVIPDETDSVWDGEGAGEWVPAMVYVPNNEIW